MKELKNINTILVCLVFNLLTATQGLRILLPFSFCCTSVELHNCHVYTGQTPCSTHNTIQLNNGGVFSSVTGVGRVIDIWYNIYGRVEICACNSVNNNSSCFWQTVSTGSLTEPISWKNSIVICRQLGYSDVQSPILQDR